MGMSSRMIVSPESITVASVWANAIIVDEIDPLDPLKRQQALNVQCGDEVKRASMGDYIVKHDDGTYDVMSPLAYQAFVQVE